jgi:2-polyprenyl-6-hydroxyphenyl methylase/3-demethylubiquinone-9 3-methyltransferase
MRMVIADNVDPAALRHFEAQAALWWDREGEFAALHDINPLRVDYVARRVPLEACRVLDVGCGGGLLSEALASRGARVTGIDLGEAALAAARAHAAAGGLAIDYRRSSAEALAAAAPGSFDAVTCMELLEHVPDPASVVSACARLVRPGGDVFFATVNRTPLAGFLVIFMAERVLGIVRRGTHRYARFVRPGELCAWGTAAGLEARDLRGLAYLPWVRRSRLVTRPRMNYLAHLRRRS